MQMKVSAFLSQQRATETNQMNIFQNYQIFSIIHLNDVPNISTAFYPGEVNINVI